MRGEIFVKRDPYKFDNFDDFFSKDVEEFLDDIGYCLGAVDIGDEAFGFYRVWTTSVYASCRYLGWREDSCEWSGELKFVVCGSDHHTDLIEKIKSRYPTLSEVEEDDS